jgi:hypothetical protein
MTFVGNGFGGVMLGREIALLSMALALSGCMTSKEGTDYAAISQKVGPPKPGQSRVVVLQKKRDGLSMALCACDVKVDGRPMGKVVVGTYVYADLPPGPHQLVASELLFPGDTKRDFTAAPGRTYFFLVKSSPRRDAVTGMSMVVGLAGAAVAAVATSGGDNLGPGEFVPLDEPSARTMLAELQLAD